MLTLSSHMQNIFAEWVEAGFNLHLCTGATKHPVTWPLTLILTPSVTPFSACTLKQHCKLRCATTSRGCMAFFWKKKITYMHHLLNVCYWAVYCHFFYVFFTFWYNCAFSLQHFIKKLQISPDDKTRIFINIEVGFA